MANRKPPRCRRHPLHSEPCPLCAIAEDRPVPITMEYEEPLEFIDPVAEE